MSKIESPQRIGELPLVLIKNMVSLATSGFGVVVALAWNELIKAFIDGYVNPYLGKDGTLTSLFIYALLMTALAVLVTMQLASIQRKMEEINSKLLSNETTSKRKYTAKAANTAKSRTKKK
jgi:hypothetical protein